MSKIKDVGPECARGMALMTVSILPKNKAVEKLGETLRRHDLWHFSQEGDRIMRRAIGLVSRNIPLR